MSSTTTSARLPRPATRGCARCCRASRASSRSFAIETPESAVRQRKRELRSHWIAVRRDRREELAELGAAVAEEILGSEELASADRIALFASLPDEIDTRPLFERLREAGRQVLLPRIPRPGVLEHVPVSRWEDLRPGRYGVPAPGSGAAAVTLGPGDLLLVPGLAFDRSGHRLGWGGGYYDRLLAALREHGVRACSVGLAASFQLVDVLPVEPHDEPLNAVVTERGWIRVGGED